MMSEQGLVQGATEQASPVIGHPGTASRRLLPIVPSVSMEEVLANSFRDFHAKGLDYVCLKRRPSETVKLYFFDGDVSKLPEVVNPHDHRYDFSTYCVSGCVQNLWFDENPKGDLYQRFAYETPLLGGDGFTWVGETRLSCVRKYSLRPPISPLRSTSYFMAHDDIHTIRMMENETVICVVQLEDRVFNRPTLTFTQDREPPSLDGLYSRFKADEVLQRLRALRMRVPDINLPEIV